MSGIKTRLSRQLRSIPGDERSRAQLENKGTRPENGTQLESQQNGAQLEKGTQPENGTQLESRAQLENRTQLENGMLHALHLCECFLDPYQTWRRQLSG